MTEHRLQSALVAKVTPPKVPEESYLPSVSGPRSSRNERRGGQRFTLRKLLYAFLSIQCGHLCYLDRRASSGECIASSTKNFHNPRNLLRTAVVHPNRLQNGMGVFRTQLKCSFNRWHHGKTSLRLSSA